MTEKEFNEEMCWLNDKHKKNVEALNSKYISLNNRLKAGDEARDNISKFKITDCCSYYLVSGIPFPVFRVIRYTREGKIRKRQSDPFAYGRNIRGGWKKDENK